MIGLLIILIFFILLWLSEIQRKKLSRIVKHLPGPREIPILGSEFVLKNDDITGEETKSKFEDGSINPFSTHVQENGSFLTQNLSQDIKVSQKTRKFQEKIVEL